MLESAINAAEASNATSDTHISLNKQPPHGWVVCLWLITRPKSHEFWFLSEVK